MSLEDGRAQTEGKGHKLWKQNPWLRWREVNSSQQAPPSPPPPPGDYGGASLSLLVEHQRWRTEESVPALCACSLPFVTVLLSELEHWQYVSSEVDLWLCRYKTSCYSIRQYCVIIRAYCTFVSYPNQHFDHWGPRIWCHHNIELWPLLIKIYLCLSLGEFLYQIFCGLTEIRHQQEWNGWMDGWREWQHRCYIQKTENMFCKLTVILTLELCPSKFNNFIQDIHTKMRGNPPSSYSCMGVGRTDKWKGHYDCNDCVLMSAQRHTV